MTERTKEQLEREVKRLEVEIGTWLDRLQAADEERAVLTEALRRARNRLVVGDYSEDDTNRYEEMAAFDSLIGCDTGGYNPREIETGLASIREAAKVER